MEVAETAFQSRAGFSESCDLENHILAIGDPQSFNPVLGFLSPATDVSNANADTVYLFQSRAGFSESCDEPEFVQNPLKPTAFQSRAGFSESCDGMATRFHWMVPRSFNPVLGFLSPATVREYMATFDALFQSRAGFSESCDDGTLSVRTLQQVVSIPCWVF